MAHQIQIPSQPQVAQILTASGQLQQVQISSHQLTQQTQQTSANQTVVNASDGGSPATGNAQQTQTTANAPQQIQPQQITLSGANGQQITVIPASSLANLQAAQQVRQQSNIIQVRVVNFLFVSRINFIILCLGSWFRQYTRNSYSKYSWTGKCTNHPGWLAPKYPGAPRPAKYSDRNSNHDQRCSSASSYNPNSSSWHANYL